MNDAQRQLEAALADQARLTQRFEESVGTSDEFSAYTGLRAASAEVSRCDGTNDATEPLEASGRFAFSVLWGRTGPGAARAELARRLDGLVGDEPLATILLLASETVTNAVTHGAVGADALVDIEAHLSADRLWLGVTNAGVPCDHVPALPDDQAPGGRGLFVVEALSRAWGTGHAAGQTSVWFEVDRWASAGALAAAV